MADTSNGFIKIYRSLLRWEWYSDINTKVVFIHLLLKANHKANKWQGTTISRGQLIASFGSIARETGLSVQAVRTAINHLKSTGEVTQTATKKYSVFTVKNFTSFQSDNTVIHKRLTNSQHTANKQLTTLKECKEGKNEKKKAAKPPDCPPGKETRYCDPDEDYYKNR